MELQEIKQRFDIVGDDPELNRALDTAIQVAKTDLSVLVTGESGVGKEVIPQIIHQYSPRKHNTYIAINCGSIPEGTVDSELFGHEKGSFTGAVETKKGYFEYADGGTIFLDEVAELPVSTQVRLLRVLQSGEFYKVGSAKVQKTNVRVVAATNVDLAKAIREGRFREDLFYRISTVPVSVPALRSRKGDINLLFRKFALDFADKNRMPPIKLDHQAQMIITEYPWPGNIRQLMSVVQRISALEQSREISAEVLKRYLPVQNAVYNNLPAVKHADKDLLDNKELLIHMILSLRKEMDALKEKVDTMAANGVRTQVKSGKYDDFEMVDDILEEEIGAEGGNCSTSIAPHRDEIASEIAGRTEPPFSVAEPESDENEEVGSIKEKSGEMIRKALQKYNGNRKKAATELGISERTLYRKIELLGIEGKKKKK